jgi:hypothetical protein
MPQVGRAGGGADASELLLNFFYFFRIFILFVLCLMDESLISLIF